MRTEEFIQKRTHEEWATLIEELREYKNIPARTLYEDVGMSPSTYDKIKKKSTRSVDVYLRLLHDKLYAYFAREEQLKIWLYLGGFREGWR